jgi:hypothetical protein
MIVNLSPSSFSYDETFNTLAFANRIKQLKVSSKAVKSKIAGIPKLKVKKRIA